jgi:hypothetical protein
MKHLPDDENQIMLTIIRCWLSQTDAGGMLVHLMGFDSALTSVVGLLNKGFLKVVSGKDQYAIKPVTPDQVDVSDYQIRLPH